MSPADDPDVRLAERAAAGDRASLEALLERHLDRIHAVCRRVTGNADDALDATQEALIAVARKVGTFDGRARFSTWVHRVAVNAALDELRRRKRRPAPAEDVPDPPRPSFEGAIDARLDVDAALADVKPEFRAAVVLRDLCDLDYEEIAAVLDVPIGTVRSRIARGRTAVARWLESGAAGNRDPRSGRPNAGGS